MQVRARAFEVQSAHDQSSLVLTTKIKRWVRRLEFRIELSGASADIDASRKVWLTSLQMMTDANDFLETSGGVLASAERAAWWLFGFKLHRMARGNVNVGTFNAEVEVSIKGLGQSSERIDGTNALEVAQGFRGQFPFLLCRAGHHRAEGVGGISGANRLQMVFPIGLVEATCGAIGG